MWILLFTMFFLGEVNASPKVSLEDLLERLESLEEWKRVTDNEVSALRDQITKQEIIIRNLERELADQTNTTAALKQSLEQENQDARKRHTDKDETSVSDEQETKKQKGTTELNDQQISQNSDIGQPAIAGGVAFTAYLDHSIDLDKRQTIKFNQIITNDGNAYNSNTGVFTCPEAGVYMFTFVLGERGDHEGTTGSWAELVVNSQFLVAASVDSFHPTQDLQGSNTAVIRLKQGDEVWVDALSYRSHVEGDDSRRFTTFTGVYLYG